MRKKLLALLMALVMVLGLNTTFLADEINSPGVDNTVEIPELKTEWVMENGKNTWKLNVENMKEHMYVRFLVRIFKDGEYMNTQYLYTTNDEYAMDIMEIPVHDYITESGTYTIEVKLQKEVYNPQSGGYYYETVGTAQSEKATYVAPEKKLAVPGNISFSKDGIISFDTVEGASCYNVYINWYDPESGDGGYWNNFTMYANNNEKTLTLDFVKEFLGTSYLYDEDFYVQVQAISGDINVAQHSEISDEIGIYKHRIEAKDLNVSWNASNPFDVVVEKIATSDYVDYYLSMNREDIYNGYGSSYYEETKDGMVFDLSYYLTMYGAGKYPVEVEARAYGETPALYRGEVLVDYNPTNKLATPTNVTLSEDGIITFDLIDGVDNYTLFLREEYLGENIVFEQSWSSYWKEDGKGHGQFDVSSFMSRIENYKESGNDLNIKFGVRAITEDIGKIATSDAAWVTLVENRVAKDKVVEELDKALETDPIFAQEVLVKTSNDTLIELMKDSAFVAKVEKAEAAYVEEMHITVHAPKSDVATIDATKIKVVGAALNANAYADVQLTVAKPTKEAVVPTGYKNGVQLDINLMVDGKSMEDLLVPVTITMPIPAGVEKEKLVILHYHGDATEPVVITPVVNEDGTMTFTVSGFSTFVVTNVAESPKTADNSVAVACAMMLVAAAAVVVFRKKAVE